MAKEWEFSILGCFSNICTCLVTSFFPCVTSYQIGSKLNKKCLGLVCALFMIILGFFDLAGSSGATVESATKENVSYVFFSRLRNELSEHYAMFRMLTATWCWWRQRCWPHWCLWCHWRCMPFCTTSRHRSGPDMTLKALASWTCSTLCCVPIAPCVRYTTSSITSTSQPWTESDQSDWIKQS